MLTVLVPLPKTSNENCANSHEKNHNQGQVKALLLIGSAGGGKKMVNYVYNLYALWKHNFATMILSIVKVKVLLLICSAKSDLNLWAFAAMRHTYKLKWYVWGAPVLALQYPMCLLWSNHYKSMWYVWCVHLYLHYILCAFVLVTIQPLSVEVVIIRGLHLYT